jgi:cobalt-zinc-cadmium efflux system protein
MAGGRGLPGDPGLRNRLTGYRLRMSAHAHDHAHHRHHHHGGTLRSLTIALVLNAAYTLVEVIAAAATGSLSLLADAGHNLSDVLALGVAAGAVVLARRPATPNRSFGLRRAEILAALVNAVSLVVIAIVVFVGAADRFVHPADVPGGWLVAVASIGLLVNLAGAAAVFRRDGRDLNLRAAYIHLVGDALGSLAVIVTGVVIVTTGWPYADPIAGVLIGVYLVVSSWSVLRESTLVLLEATPRGLDAEEIARAMLAEPGVVQVHDLHVWEITSGFVSLSAHVLVHEGDDCHAIRRTLERTLAERYEITHTTLQVDHEHVDRLLTIAPSPRR